MSLSTLNKWASILHYSLAIGFASYFRYVNNKYPNNSVRGIELSVRDHNLGIESITGECKEDDDTICDPSGNAFRSTWVSANTRTIDVKTIQAMLILFFIITGTFHFYYYVGNGTLGEKESPSFSTGYTYVIKNQNNFFRWIEYSITATLMLYIIALTSGVKDTNVYLLLYATNIAMIALGQQVEVAVRDGKDWITPMLTSFLLLFAEFSIIARSFWSRLSQVDTFLDENPSISNGRRIPKWLNAMIIILFLFFSCFGFLSLYASIRGTPYETVEKGYIILSFAAKATLGMFIAYGTAQRQTNA
jgi:hypothetical protein